MYPVQPGSLMINI